MPTDRIIFSFFRYGLSRQLGAFIFMGFQRLFNDVQAPRGSVRLMGCGGGDGFSVVPDPGTYCLMNAIPDRTERDQVCRSGFYRRIAGPSREQLHITLEPWTGHGTWDGAEPFAYSGSRPAGVPFAVLTHAHVRPAHARDFWQSAPQIRADLRDAPGCAFHIGFGEHPLLTLATFSIWDDLAAMQRFAYRDSAHARTQRAARNDQWLRESLFARFGIVAISGDLDRYPGLAAVAARLPGPVAGRPADAAVALSA